MKRKYSVKGMTCSACENHVHNSVCKLPGVEHVEVNLLTNSMNVEFDETKVDDSMIIKAVKDGGYQASSYDDALVEKEINLLFHRTWITDVCINVINAQLSNP